MDPIALGKALSDLGWATLFIVVVLAATFSLWKGWWIPGFIARRDQERADRLEAENRILAVTVATLTAELRQSRRERRERIPGARDGAP